MSALFGGRGRGLGLGLSSRATLGLLVCVGTACGPADPPTTGGTAGTGGNNGGAVGAIAGAGGSATGAAGSPAQGGGGGAAVAGSSGAAGAAGAPATGAQIPLPLVVTSHFDNQGWFADPSIEKAFAGTPAVIQQAPSSEGPCAARPSGAQGRCLKIVYTPPAGVVAPGWVGVFFLSNVTKASGMVKAGDPNWGVEPGKKVAAGAKQIKFWAAATVADTRVEFKAGTSPGELANTDEFTVAAAPQTLGTSWNAITLPIIGTYSAGVIGAFAWAITDTAKPATFYLDGIVWE